MGRVRASFGITVGVAALVAAVAVRVSTAFGFSLGLEQAILPWAALALAVSALLSAWLARPERDLWLQWGLLPLAGLAGPGLCLVGIFGLGPMVDALPAGLEAAGGFALIVSALRFRRAQALRLARPVDLHEKRKVRLIRDGQKKRPEVPVASLESGDLIEIKPGADIPVDGEVMQGSGFVDETALMGPILPVAKQPTDPVFAGTQSSIPELVVRTRRPLEQALIAQREQRFAEVVGDLGGADRWAKIWAGLGVVLIVLMGSAPLLGEQWPSMSTLISVWAGLVLAIVLGAPALSAGRARLTAAARLRAHGVLLTRAKDVPALMSVRRWQVDPLLVAAPGSVEAVSFADTPKDTLLTVAEALLSESYGPEQISVRAAVKDKKLESLQPAALKRETGVHRGTVNGRRWYMGSAGALEDQVKVSEDMQGPLQFLKDQGHQVWIIGRDDDEVLGAVGISVGAGADASALARSLNATVMPGLPDGIRQAVAAAAQLTCDGPPLGKHDASLLTRHAELPSSGARLRVLQAQAETVLPEQAAPRVLSASLAKVGPVLADLPALKSNSRKRVAIALVLPVLLVAPLTWLAWMSPGIGALIGLAVVGFTGRAFDGEASASAAG